MSEHADAPPHDGDSGGGGEPPTMPTLSWLDDDEPESDAPDRRRRRLVLLVAGIVPWVVVAVVLLRPSAAEDAARRPAPSATTGAAATDIAAAEPDVTATATTATDPQPTHAPTSARTEAPGGPVATLITGQGRATPAASDAAALAVVAARAWLTGVGPRLDLDLPDGPPLAEESYLEHVTVEAVDWPAPGAAVVSLLVVLLEADEQEYRDVAVRRLAVPIRLDADGAAVGGPPWWLPDPAVATDMIDADEQVDDPDLLRTAAAALAVAGFDEPLARLERTEGWPWLATLGNGDATPQVWLRPHLGGFVVAGSLPPEPDDTAPTPTPELSPAPAPAASETADDASQEQGR